VIAVALWFSSCALILPDPLELLAVFGLCLLAAIAVNGLQARNRLRQLRTLLPLLLSLMAIQLLFTRQGSVLGRVWGFSFYSGGLDNGLALALRLLLIFHAAQLLLRLGYPDFEAAFSAVRLPEELGFMVFYTVQIVPRVGEDFKHLRNLLALRGIELGKLGLKARLRVYALISLTVVARVISRSGIQAIALELRGFRSGGKRSRLHHYRFGLADLGLLALLCALSFGLYLW
jgi:energy-coupling factor transport system permease protein